MTYLKYSKAKEKGKDKPQIIFDPVTEAGWYALSPFINTMDFDVLTKEYLKDGDLKSYRGPINKNHEIMLLWRGVTAKYMEVEGAMRMVECSPDDPEAGKPMFTRTAKSAYQQHRVSRNLPKGSRELLYYRGNTSGRYSSGFGGSDALALRTPFSKALNVTTERKVYPVGAMLFTIDVDFHKDQYPEGTINDAPLVLEWLLNDYFPQVYWEMSTNGNGFHIYIKTLYDASPENIWSELNLLTYALKQYLIDLDALRESKCFKSKIDTRLFGIPSKFDRSKGEIKRACCMKLPFFPTMEDVQRFYWSPVFLPRHFSLYKREEQGREDITITSPPSGLGDKDIYESIEIGGDGWNGVKSRYHNNSRKRSSFTSQIEALRQLKDSTSPKAGFNRINGFYKLICRQKGRLLDAEEANRLYLENSLNKTNDTQRRLVTFRHCYNHLKDLFDPSKASKIKLEGWTEERTGLEAEVMGLEVIYKRYKGKKRSSMKILPVPRVAGVLFVLRKLAKIESDAFFSYTSLRAFFKEATGMNLCKDSIKPCLDALEKAGLIHIVQKGSLDMQAGRGEGTKFTVPVAMTVH